MPHRRSLVRASIQKLHPYTPGEQPKIKGLTKLNTNENPYPPSPKVLQAIRQETSASLRLYPDPVSTKLREKIGTVYGFKSEEVIAGNGSDDILTLCLRAFVDEGALVQFPKPTYSLYSVLTQIQNGRFREIPFDSQYQLDPASFDSRAALTFVVRPNAPTGTSIPKTTMLALARRLKGVLVIDEAYADFAEDHCLDLARSLPNVIVCRTFSKSFSLAGIRLGFALGSEGLIEALFKVKDSYNVDRLAQVAGTAALSDMAYHRKTVAQIKETRRRFVRDLELRGWRSLPSETNFVFCRPPALSAKEWLARLREKKVLVRWFGARETRDFLRVTIGTPAEMKVFVQAVDLVSRQVVGKRRGK
jgi:histidinol-phosphate aminotransferase